MSKPFAKQDTPVHIPIANDLNYGSVDSNMHAYASDRSSLLAASPPLDPLLSSTSSSSSSSLSSVFMKNDDDPTTPSFVEKLRNNLAAVWGIHPLVTLLPSLILVAVIWPISPPDGLTPAAIHLLAVFSGVISGLFVCRYSLSTLLALAIAVLTLTGSFQCTTEDGEKIDCSMCRHEWHNSEGQLSHYQCDPIGGAFDVATSGFSENVPWLVFTAFHIGKAVEVSGLGKRISLWLISSLGGSLLGIAYAITISEICLAAFIPSNTARGGGIIYPIVNSVITTLELDNSPRSNSVGGFLVMSSAYTNVISSALYITGMAGNPLLASKVTEIFDFEVTFIEWLVGAIVPVLLIAALTPLVLHQYHKPSMSVYELQYKVSDQLQELGSVTSKEIQLCLVLFLCLTLWIGTPIFGINSTVVAYTALVVLILLEIITWNDVLKNSSAWDAFFWLACFIVLAEQLTALGVTHWLGDYMSITLQGSSPLFACVSLSLFYYFSTYFFSSITSHLVAFAGPLLAAAQELGCSPHLAFILFAIFSSVSAVLTPFSTGSVAIYASMPFVQTKSWITAGLVMTAMIFTVIATAGFLWWTILGWI